LQALELRTILTLPYNGTSRTRLTRIRAHVLGYPRSCKSPKQGEAELTYLQQRALLPAPGPPKKRRSSPEH